MDRDIQSESNSHLLRVLTREEGLFKGSRMARGGAREGAGRPVGSVSEVKRRLAMLAQEHAETAIQALADIAS